MVVAFLAAAICVLAGSVALATTDTTAPVVTSVTPADGSTIYTNGTGTTYYQISNSTPLTIKADYADEAGGSGVDPTTIMVHLDIGNMLMNCPVQTDTHVECVATAADLPPGLHPIDVYVGDYAGNEADPPHRTWVTVVADTEAPTYSNLTPVDGSTIYTSQLNSANVNDMSALRIDYDIADADPSSGWSPMTHINDNFPQGGSMGAMISNTSCVKTPATNPTHYSCQVNRAKLLQLGDNTLSVLIKDKVGNESPDYGHAPGAIDSRKHYTVVDDVTPNVTNVTADATTISATFSDPQPTGALSTNLASGIDSGSATVTFDGNLLSLSGCTVTTSGISCPTPANPGSGEHAIVVSVSDTAGNSGSGNGSYIVACSTGKPSLSLGSPVASWGSYADYLAGLLSVSWTVSNNGADAAENVQILTSTATNSVTLASSLPASVGHISAGGSGNVVLQYQIPAAVGSFRVTNTASAEDGCGNLYTYP